MNGGSDDIDVQRDRDNPFVFFRVGKATEDQEEQEPTVQCFTATNDIVEMAKKLIQINLVTFSMLVSMLPQNIIHIVYFGKPENEQLEKILAIVGYFQLPFIVLFPFLIYKKLDKNI